MSRLCVRGLGAVSPAGWGASALWSAVQRAEPCPTRPLSRPGWEKPLWIRETPPPSPRPAFLSHPRYRRTSAISHYTAAAALEALGEDAVLAEERVSRLGIVVCVMAGCVSYSRRFYEETLKDPATASPLLFPETVFNAPASHLAAYLGATGPAYTLIGDNGAFLQGLALAAGWLVQDQADACVIVGAEEADWIVADALRLFQRRTVHSSGAGALYLAREHSACIAELSCVTDSFSFTANQNQTAAAAEMRRQLPPAEKSELLCLGTEGIERADAPEMLAWGDWTGHRLAPRAALGEAFSASAAWQCVLACDAIQRMPVPAANVSVVGVNQQAIGARFVKTGA